MKYFSIKTLVFFLLTSATYAANSGFDELFENGKPRTHYKAVIQQINRTPKSTIRKMESESLKLFMRDNVLAAFPRLLTKSEATIIEKGTQQRAQALQLFLQDYANGNWNKFEHIIPKQNLEQILIRNKEHVYLNDLKNVQFSFPYGADIIRDSTNTWRVIEDNIGYIGGPGDINKARKIMQKIQPQLMKKIKALDDTQNFYKGIENVLKDLSKDIPGARSAMLSFPPFPDNEDIRLQSELKKLDIQPITPKSETKLIIQPGKGVFYKNKSSNELVRVGSLFVNTEFDTLDPSHPSVFKKSLLLNAENKINSRGISLELKQSLNLLLNKIQDEEFFVELEKFLIKNFGLDLRKVAIESTYYPGLLNEYFAGRVKLNYTPGIDFLGDKEFYFYVEDLIRFYLKEEPVIKNIESVRFAKLNHANSPVLNTEILEKVFSNQNDWVVKSFDGRGGDAVWVGAKISSEKFLEAKAKVLENPSRYLAQKYTPLSTYQDLIVDLRQIAYISPERIFVSETKWGRGVPSSGDGKVNISSSGREMAIVVVPDPNPCTSEKINKVTELLQ